MVDISLSMRCSYTTTILNLWSDKGYICAFSFIAVGAGLIVWCKKPNNQLAVAEIFLIWWGGGPVLLKSKGNSKVGCFFNNV